MNFYCLCMEPGQNELLHKKSYPIQLIPMLSLSIFYMFYAYSLRPKTVSDYITLGKRDEVDSQEPFVFRIALLPLYTSPC